MQELLVIMTWERRHRYYCLKKLLLLVLLQCVAYGCQVEKHWVVYFLLLEREEGLRRWPSV
jgi:hypothetical protein